MGHMWVVAPPGRKVEPPLARPVGPVGAQIVRAAEAFFDKSGLSRGSVSALCPSSGRVNRMLRDVQRQCDLADQTAMTAGLSRGVLQTMRPRQKTTAFCRGVFRRGEPATVSDAVAVLASAGGGGRSGNAVEGEPSPRQLKQARSFHTAIRVVRS